MPTPTVQASPRADPMPPPPRTLDDVGLPLRFVADLALKALYFRGSFTGRELAEHLCLPFPIVEPAIKMVTDAGHCSSGGMARGDGAAHNDNVIAAVRWDLSDRGRERARELMEISQYSGPAPVPVDLYAAVARRQTHTDRRVGVEDVRAALRHLVLADEIVDELGPALNGRQAVFLYGSPGNGKTSIAEACAQLLGPPLLVPRALYAHGEVIRLFDPSVHEPVDTGDSPEFDRRWVLVRRPEVKVGAELAPHSLELGFDARLGFYEASTQLKANGGIFFVDDFGRQTRMSPTELLNRLIVPLGKGVDYLNLARAGTTIGVPFTTTLILATNLRPQDLIDEAFLRRIRYKVLVSEPDEAAYRHIWRMVCEERDVIHDERAIDHLVDTWYRRAGRTFRGVHPRDLLDHVVSSAMYHDRQPALTGESLDAACRAYFVRDPSGSL